MKQLKNFVSVPRTFRRVLLKATYAFWHIPEEVVKFARKRPGLD